MSLSLTLSSPQCPTCGEWGRLEYFNITYNVSCMWSLIFPDHKEMLPIEGWTGQDSIPILEYAIEEMEALPMVFKAMNPANGWGSSTSLLKTLKVMLEAARKYPKGVWEASR